MGILKRKDSPHEKEIESAPADKDRKYVLRTSLKRDLYKMLLVRDRIEMVGKWHIKFKNGNYWGGFLPKEFPSSLPVGFLNGFIRPDLPVTIGIYLNRYHDDYSLALLQRNLTVLKGELYYYQQLGAVNSEKYARIMREVSLSEELRDMIVAKQTHLYDTTFVVGLRGENYQKFKENRKRIEIMFKGLNFRLFKGIYRIWHIFRATLPLAKREIPYYNPMHLHTDSAVAFFPFTSGVFSTFGPNAILFGFNEVNETPIFVDRFLYPSYNMMVFGQTGSGKSFFTKLTMVRSRIANPKVMIYVIDPLGEYGELMEAMGGLNVDLWNPDSEGPILNPLDRAMGENDHERVKNLISLFTTVFEMSREEKVFLDSVLHRLYRANPEEEVVLGDLIEKMEESIAVIRKTEGERAGMRYEKLLNAMQIFDSGSLSFLNRPSTVDIEGYKYVNFNLKNVPEDYKPFFMFFILNYVYTKIKDERYKDIPKLIYVDEAHVVWKFPECAERLDWMFRHARHMHAGMTLITQSVNDGFINEHTRAMLENTYIHLLLHHDMLTDEAIEFYRFTNEQESQIRGAQGAGKEGSRGYSNGLLVVGPMRFPIKILAAEEEKRFMITG